MKNLLEIVTNLELSKKLKELGVEQEGLFYWLKGESENKPTYGVTYSYGKSFAMLKARRLNMVCRAFTASELMELLPDRSYQVYNSNGVWLFTDHEYSFQAFSDNDFVNAIAKMFIYLDYLEGENE